MNDDKLSIFNTLARIYDTIYTFTEDLEFWADVIEEWCSNKARSDVEILELGSGTGRVLLYLAKKGYKTTGLEISKEMIKVCRIKLKRLSKRIQNRVKIYNGDMKEFNISQKFDFVICPFNTFADLLSSAERKSTLLSISNHLKNNGLFICDIWQKPVTKLEPGWSLWNYETGQKFYPYLKEKMFWCEYATINPTEMLEQIEISVTRIKNSNSSSITLKSLLKIFIKEKIEQEFQECNFVIKKIYGDYFRNSWSIKSPLMNFVVQKK